MDDNHYLFGDADLVPRDHVEALVEEQSAKLAVHLLASALAEASEPIWRLGDGFGGEVRAIIERAFRAYGLPEAPPKAKPKKQPIPAGIRKAVFERDAYRCVFCGSYLDLQVDHVHPESKGGDLHLDNLQTLCATCNKQKGVRLAPN